MSRPTVEIQRVISRHFLPVTHNDSVNPRRKSPYSRGPPHGPSRFRQIPINASHNALEQVSDANRETSSFHGTLCVQFGSQRSLYLFFRVSHRARLGDFWRALTSMFTSFRTGGRRVILHLFLVRARKPGFGVPESKTKRLGNK